MGCVLMFTHGKSPQPACLTYPFRFKASLMNHTYIYYLLIFQLSLHIRHTPFYQRFRQIYLAALRTAQDLGVEIVPQIVKNVDFGTIST